MSQEPRVLHPRDTWVWYGKAGHLCVSDMCQFHLTTKVGPWLVSTVGHYLPDEGSREILAKHRGVELEGKGDARKYDFLKKHGWEELGVDRTFETMVFRAGAPCESDLCRCGVPTHDGKEVAFAGYQTAMDAHRGHHQMCEKFSREGAEHEQD